MTRVPFGSRPMKQEQESVSDLSRVANFSQIDNFVKRLSNWLHYNDGGDLAIWEEVLEARLTSEREGLLEKVERLDSI